MERAKRVEGVKENNRLYPTDMGRNVLDLLLRCFDDLFEYG